MDDMTPFDELFEERLRAFARTGVKAVDSAEVARAAAAGTQRRTRRVRWGLGGVRTADRWPVAAAVVIGLLVIGGAFFVFQRNQSLVVANPSPTPTSQPSPSLNGVVPPPSSTPIPTEPAGPSEAPTSSAVAPSTGVWIHTGSLGTARYGHTAVRLLDGRVLVVGGVSGDENLTSPELYDPVHGTWSATGNMLKPHAGFRATLLSDGKVLVGDVDDPGALDPVFGAEEFDPDSGTWAATGRMVNADPGTATLLRDGRVLVTGSDGTSSQLFDPVSGTWTSAGKMVTPSRNHAATLLPDGKVLVVGGFDVQMNRRDFDSAELFDPATGTWTPIAPMHAAKANITATLLPDGKVLVVGGWRSLSSPPELYDPATGTWTVIGDPARPGTFYDSATLLSDGTVLLTDPPDAALYDPGTGSWTATGTMLGSGASGYQAPATPLLDGTVLVAGGRECSPDVDGRPGECTETSSAELYVPAGVSPPSAVLALPSPTPNPGPTPRIPIPPAVGPIPPGARTWKVTVRNRSDRPATLFVAEETDDGDMGQLVGSATPNVVPPGATVKVTFLVPAKGARWVIFVNPPGPIGGPIVGPAEMSRPVQILIMADGQPAWMSP